MAHTTNYWFISRPKRKITPVPEIFSAFIEDVLHAEWSGKVGKHINFEDELERQGLKRKGNRRDQGGSGGRTYASWLFSLGLYFEREGKIYPTLAGERLINGDPPVEILKHQVLKFQYPSSYSTRSRVNISKRFRIRPFRFILKLLMDQRVDYLTEEELAKIVMTEAENETERCYEYIVNRIVNFRNQGDIILPKDFNKLYASRAGVKSFDDTVVMLGHVANTFFNWAEYTQLVFRDKGRLMIIPEKWDEVGLIINYTPPLIQRYDDEEYFQRKFGVDPSRTKDTRNVSNTAPVTADTIARRRIRTHFLSMASKTPILKIDQPIIDELYLTTGMKHDLIADELSSFTHGALGSFEAAYFDMALRGRDKANDFERATVEFFKSAFEYETTHVGNKGKHPDVLIESNNYSGIIDTKAYASYSITNDHMNRMLYNYIPTYIERHTNLKFFLYISGGFGVNFDSQVRSLAEKSKLSGAGITTTNLINLARKYKQENLDHSYLIKLFTLNREIRKEDLG